MKSHMQMRHDNYGHHIWKADDMAAFLLETTGIKIDKVSRLCLFRSGTARAAAMTEEQCKGVSTKLTQTV